MKSASTCALTLSTIVVLCAPAFSQKKRSPFTVPKTGWYRIGGIILSSGQNDPTTVYHLRSHVYAFETDIPRDNWALVEGSALEDQIVNQHQAPSNNPHAAGHGVDGWVREFGVKYYSKSAKENAAIAQKNFNWQYTTALEFTINPGFNDVDCFAKGGYIFGYTDEAGGSNSIDTAAELLTPTGSNISWSPGSVSVNFGTYGALTLPYPSITPIHGGSVRRGKPWTTKPETKTQRDPVGPDAHPVYLINPAAHIEVSIGISNLSQASAVGDIKWRLLPKSSQFPQPPQKKGQNPPFGGAAFVFDSP